MECDIVVLLDTCALIFWTLDPDALTVKARKTIEASEQVGISAISLWEIGIKAKRKGLDLPLSFGDYVDRLRTVDGLDILPVDDRIWVANVDLDWDHRDPADRTIVATAMIHGLSLITSDARIQAFYTDTIW